MSGRNLSRCFACPVAETMLMVRPWKLLSVAMTSVRAVTLRASLTAASLASAPLLLKNTRVSPAGAPRRAARGAWRAPEIREPGVRVLDDARALLRERAHNRRMGVPDAGDAPAGGEVQVPPGPPRPTPTPPRRGRWRWASSRRTAACARSLRRWSARWAWAPLKWECRARSFCHARRRARNGAATAPRDRPRRVGIPHVRAARERRGTWRARGA